MTGIIRTLLATLLVALAGLAAAQQAADPPDYAAWEKTAARAEEAVEAGRASTAALEGVRDELVGWRQTFSEAQTANANTIKMVQDQLRALGPPPEDSKEAADISAQRSDLNKRLATLQAPVKTAELAYSRANGLIGGIDRIIRDRQTEELFDAGPLPVNPVHWGAGLGALAGMPRALYNETAAAWANPVQRAKTIETLPATLLMAALGLVLVVRGRAWSRRLTGVIVHGEPGAGRWLAGFGASLGSLLLPFGGVLALIEALYSTDLIGLRGDLLLSSVVTAVFAALLARWLAARIFPPDDSRAPPLLLEAEDRMAGRFHGASLGVVIAAYQLLRDAAEIFGWSVAAMHVVLFPVLVIAGLLLWRLARLLRLHVAASADETGTETYRGRMGRLLSRALVVLAVVAPLLAAAGYVKAAQFLMIPSLISLLLLAALLVLQRLVVEIYVLVTRNAEGAAESLVPVLIGFALAVTSAPLFALIWGARVADLTELWASFTKGVYLGETRISPTIFLTLAVVFIIGYVLTRLLQGTLKNTVLPKTRIDTGGRNAIVAGVGYFGIFLSAVIAITSAGIDLSSLAIVAGALSVGIGFGLQNIVSNFVSGIILLIERPISEGDWIEVGGQHGYVRDISVRSTRIETFDRTDVIVPNSDFISGTVTNYTRGNTVGRVIVPVGVAYGTDTHKVERILQEIGAAHPLVLANPAPYVVFKGFGPNSLDFEIRAILRDVNWVLNVHSEMNHEIARRFVEEGIEIPFAQRDVWLRNPEALGGGAGRPETGSGET